MVKMKKIYFALFLILICPALTMAGISMPSEIYDPPEAVYDASGNKQVFDLVAHGSNEDWQAWEFWINDTKALELIGIGKLEESYVVEGSMDDFTITPTPINGATEGTWQYTGSNAAFTDKNSEFSLYFSVKAGSINSGAGYNLFVMNDQWYDNINQVVDWTTEMNTLYIKNALVDIGLDNKEISHLAFWTGRTTLTPPTTGSEVPEPATMVLFGMGMIVLAGIGRKKYKD